MRFKETLELYIKHLKGLNYSVSTIKSHKRIINRFWKYLFNRKISLNDVNPEVVLDYVKVLKESKIYCNNYIYTQISDIKVFYRFLYRNKYINENSINNYSFIRTKKELPKNLLNIDEINILMSNKTDNSMYLRDKAIVELYYATGLRLSELINLNYDDIEYSRNLIFVRSGKGKKDRIIPVTDYALEQVKNYIIHIRNKLKTNIKALFLSFTGKRIHRTQIRDMLIKMKDNCNLEKNVTPHTLRHCFATHLLQNGASIRSISEMLGHENIGTTEKYTKVEISDLEKVIKTYHPLENELYNEDAISLPNSDKFFTRSKGLKRKKRSVK